MRAGDVLLAINGLDLVANKYSMEAVKGLIRGPPGSQVKACY
jgi:C-terminal processing protease CtpA/Prc